MANPKDQGMTAQEAVERFCTDWARAGMVSGDPGDAESQLTKMLCHEKTDQPPRTTKQVTPQSDRVRRRAKKALKGLKKPRPKKRKQAVFKAMITARQNPDQLPEPVRLWATGRRVPVDPSKPREPIPTDMWEFLVLDIEGKGAAGKGLEYCYLRFFDAEPAQAVSEDAQDAVAIVDATKALNDQLQRAAELSEPATPAVPPLDSVNLTGAERTAAMPTKARDDNAAAPQKTKKEQKVLRSPVGRKPGQAPFARSDKLLVKEMHKLVGDDEEETSVSSAARQFAPKAKGAGTLESKVDRLRKRYREEHPLKEL